MTQASYIVQSRQNSTLQLAGIIDDYSTLDMLLRYNDVSEWTMTIDRRSLHMPNLIPVSNPIGMNGNGLVITRDYGAGPQVILSGPITHIDYQKSSQIATLKGYDDKIWLAWRNADTVPSSYPYSTAVLALSPLGYWRLNEAAGVFTCTDASGHSRSGTQHGGITNHQTGLIEDTDTCQLFNGTNGNVTFSATSAPALPTGNAAWSLAVWAQIAANPAANAMLFQFGSTAVKSGAGILMNTSGQVSASTNSGDTAFSSALAPGISHFLVATYDGTTLWIYVDGQPVQSATPGPLTVGTTGGAIGATVGTASFFPGYLDEAAVFSGALTAAQVLFLYQVGRSRNAYQASDNRSGTASTVMIAYVNNNAGPGTLAKRQVANLTMAADTGIGGQVTGVAREDNLLALLQNLALQSGDNIGFQVQQTLNVGSNTMAFSCFAPNDKTSNAIFSDEIGNLADYSYSADWPTMNVATVGDGSNSGAARNFLEVPNAGSVTAYGRVEGFVLGAASTDYQTMLNAGNAALLQTKAATNLSITPVDTAGLMYQHNYNLGDKVTIVLEGQTVQDKVREVHLQLQKGSGQNSPDEIVTPAIGQPNVATAVTGLLSWLATSVNKRLQRTTRQVGQLERNR